MQYEYDSFKMVMGRSTGILFSILAFWCGSAFASTDSCTNGHCCTYAQGGWGGMNESSSVLSSQYAAVYPGGVVEVGIPGAAGFSMKFTSASAIARYLPAAGPPQALNADAMDPTNNTGAGVFGGEVLALKLNIDFNDAHVIPGATNCHFGDLKLADVASPLSGKTVREILAIANVALGGGNISSNGVTLDALNEVVDRLNGAFAECLPLMDSPAPVSLLELMVGNGFLIAGGKKFANFRFLGDTNKINPANIHVEMAALFGSCLGLRFRGGLIATGEDTDIGLLYSVETTNGLPQLDEIGQSFTYSGSGNGGIIVIGETVWANGFFSGFVAQSSIGFGDAMDAPAEPLQGDALVIAPPRAKVWVTKDVHLVPADPQSSLELKNIDQVFCGTPVNCCMESSWAMTNLSRCTDTTPPTITCATNRTVECGQAWNFDPPTARDNCSDVTIALLSTSTNAVSGHGCAIEATRTWSATDRCGNTSICSQTVTIVDSTPPILTCGADRTVDRGTAWTFDSVTAFDQCGGTNVILRIVSTTTNTAGFCGNTFSVTRTWEASDPCTNSARCSQTITVRDTTPPLILCAKNKKVDCDESWDFHPPTLPAGGNPVTISIVNTVTNRICGPSFAATRTWEVTDGCGNVTNCSQTVTVEAKLDIDCADDKTVECGASWEFDAPSVKHCHEDHDVDVDVVYTMTNYLPNGRHQVTRKWRIKDSCGNEDSCKQIVTVIDNAPPDVRCAPDKSVECGSAWKFDAPSASEASVAVAGTWTNGACGGTYTATRTWEITGHCGNRVQCSQTVTIVDTVAPILLKCPTNLVVECNAVPEPARVTAADPVSAGPGEQILLSSNNIVGGSGSWNNTTWNDSGSPFNAFHIVDNQTGPIFEPIPGNFWLGREGHPMEQIVIDLGKPFFIDRIDLFNTHDYVLDNRRTKDFQISGGNTVTGAGVNGLDLDGSIDLILSNRLSFHLAKNDPIEPDTFTAGNGLTPCVAYRYLRFESLSGYGNEGIGLNEIRIFGRMVCDPEVPVTFDEVRAEGLCPQSYTLTRTWTATDACGNSNHWTQTVTVRDTTPPVVTCPPNRILQNAAQVPACPANLAAFLAMGGSAGDQCDSNLTYTCSDGPMAGEPGDGWIIRRHMVIDSCGNSNSCVQVFFISDSPPPLALPLPLPSSRLSIFVDAEAGWVILQWDAVPGARYCVQSKDDLPGATWAALPGEVQPDGNTAVKEDTFDPGHTRLYRVVRLP